MTFGSIKRQTVTNDNLECMVRIIRGDDATCFFVAVKGEYDWAAYTKPFSNKHIAVVYGIEVEETALRGSKLLAEHAEVLFPHAVEEWGQYRV